MNKKLTNWFPDDVKPVHIGVYETKRIRLGEGYSHWNGKEWGNQMNSIGEAFSHSRINPHGLQNKEWRGLADKP